MFELFGSKVKELAPPPIPTALTARETRELYGLALNKKVVEFGSLLGYSTICMGYSAKRIWAIDPHDGYPKSDPRPTWEPFLANLKRFGVEDVVIPMRYKGQECKGLLYHIRPVDLVFIDITREAEELLQLAHKLEPGKIVVHDYGLKAWPEATYAVDKYSRTWNKPFRLVDTLAIFEWY